MMGGPITDAITTIDTTAIPKTARWLRLKRFHASFHSDVPTTASSVIVLTVRLKADTTDESSVPHARVDKPVRDIDEQIEEQDCNRDERDDADDQRLIAIQV